MKRVVEPEWLDTLPADDAGAAGSRRDLRRLNRIMGHAEILGGLLRAAMGRRAPRRIVELGAGDGTLMLRLAGRLSREWKGVTVTLVDCKSAVSEATRGEFAALGWTAETVTADIFEWLKRPAEPADAMTANLFLHQFKEGALVELLGLVMERTGVLAACEPRRAGMPLAFSKMTGFIGCNAVTRHDAVLSVRAGFAGKEISGLWPEKSQWRLQEGSARWFSHVFLAERNQRE